MVAVLLLVLLTLGAHRIVLQPLEAGLQLLLYGSWTGWALLLLGLWLFAGRQR